MTPWGTETIDTRKRQVKLTWSGVSPGTMLTAEFHLQSGATGVYTWAPTSVKYTDYNRNTYTGTCNPAVVTVSLDTDPPAAPKIESFNRMGGVNIKLSNNGEPDLAGFDFYRRIPGGAYQPIQCNPFFDNVCTDTTVAAGQTYYYAAKARDTSGNESTFSKETATTFIPPVLLASLNFNADSAATGDLNGDGYRDLVLGQVYFTKNKGGRVAVYWGRAGGGFNSSPGFTIASPEIGDEFGRNLAVVDLNNDGYDDLIVGAPGHDEPKTYPIAGTAYEAGQIYVFAGGPQLSDTPVVAKPGGYVFDCDRTGIYLVSERWGEKIAPAGDVNGDGYQDVVIGAPNGGLDRSGKIILLYGGPTISGVINTWNGSSCYQNFGQYVAPAGDVNGDGYDDVLAGTGSSIRMLFGGASPQLSMNTFCCGADSMRGLDFNGDGFSDIFAGSYLIYGAASWSAVQTYLGSSLDGPTTAADVNGDGYQDRLSANGSILLGNGVDDYLMDVQFQLTEAIRLRGIADANGDGIPDPIFLDADGYMKVYSLAPLLTLPEIVISSPRDGESGASNLIEGFVSGNPVRLVVDGIETPIGADGAFSVELPLTSGDQTIEILAEAADGRLGKRVLHFYYYEPQPLTVVITSPADGTVANAPVLRVIVSPNNPWTSATVNGVLPNVEDLPGYDFSADVPLTEGANTITAEVVDVYGRTGAASITVHLLTTGGLTGIVSDAGSGSPMPNATVAATDALGVPFTAQTDNDGVYSLTGLHQGAFTASFSQTGYINYPAAGTIVAGQNSTLNVVLTPFPPLNLAITSPTDGQTVHETPIAVSGTVNNEASVTVNGVAAVVGGGVFTAEVPLVEGANVITAAAADQYNQIAAAGVTVSLVYLPPTVNISAGPSTVLAGESATLSWTSTDTQTAAIEPGVGTVEANGSVAVTPAETTTYTITVTGPGGTATDSVTVTVTHPAPTVSLSAEPAEIQGGSSATLTWTSTEAQSATIEPDVGAVEPSGSLAVMPTQTTTYTITVTGLGGTAQATATVTVTWPLPTVNISAAPEAIKVGQPVTISWTSANSDSCAIDQGVGTVALSGSVEVRPTETTVYTITATGPGGTNSANVTVDVDNPFTINIISPTPGSAINRPDVLVHGTVVNSWGNETAVTVNGEMGLFNGSQVAANHVHLFDGENTITVTATDAEGYQFSKSITVYANTAVDYVRLDPSPVEGVAPMESVLTVNGNVEIASADFSWQGPGPVTFLGQNANSITASLATPGLYIFSVAAHDAQGATYPDSAAVNVWDYTNMDALLRNIWGRMKQALAVGDVNTALSFHTVGARSDYAELYAILESDLPTIIQEMNDITPVVIDSDYAQYRMQRPREFNGQVYDITYFIYFCRDEYGIWRIDSY